MRLKSRYLGRIFRLARLLFASALLIASIPPSWALAQSTNDPWDEPLNISRSGIALHPAIVSDSEGVMHVVWQDDRENYMYTRLDGDQWLEPKKTNLADLFPPSAATSSGESETVPTGPNPFFIAGPGDYIFAFWINPFGALWSSRVNNEDFEHVAAWDSVSLITPKAVSFAAAVDTRGEWHLAYVRTADEPGHPPGIYYTRSRSGGRYWVAPELLYESDYFRGLTASEANLSIVTASTEGASHIYVAWDNRPRKQVLLAQSADSGRSWEQPVLIAGPAPDSELAGPFNIHIGAHDDSVVLVWQHGQPGGTCSQVSQFSSDKGATWSAPQTMGEDLLGCAQSFEFVTELSNHSDGPLYLLINAKGQFFLTPWNGREWKPSQEQTILSGFKEPEIYTDVIYGCHQATLSGERLYVVGCDQGEGGDVWITSRDLGEDTFRVEPPVWSQLSSVTSENLEIQAVELVTTNDGFIHAFVSQHRDRAIYYTYWDGELWSHINPVLKVPDGEAGQPAVATGSGNELFLIVPNNRGALYFSRATSGDAGKQSRWSAPTQLVIDHDGEIGSVDVAWDAAGTLYVAYAVPVNERRGIYLVQSKDHGASWSEPLQVFDGAATGFDLMGAPSLLAYPDGSLHMIWNVQSIQGYGIPQPLALYYAQSEDAGHTFNVAEQVVEEPVGWQEIATDAEGNLHLLWQPHDTITTVWDQVSLDGGDSWQFPQGLPDKGRLAAVTRDPAGRLHVVGVGLATLDLWLWDGSHWQSEEPLPWTLASPPEDPVQLLAAAINKHGEMVVVMVVTAGTGETAERMLMYSNRTLKLPPQHAETQEIPTQTPLPATLPPATLTPEPLLTPTALIDNGSANQGPVDPVEANNPITPFTMALLPVALILLGVLGVVIRQVAQARDR